MILKHFFVLFIVGLAQISIAQVATLYNTSFEDEPGDATMPMGWYSCQNGTTPDILPGYWGVFLEPTEGDTYVGLITRNDGSFESIGQRLDTKLEKGSCYRFALDLAVSDNYAGYSNPLKLRIWVGGKKCRNSQMVFESPLIENTDWENFEIEFTPESDVKYLIFEAFHDESGSSYKGNILLDNITPIFFCSRA